MSAFLAWIDAASAQLGTSSGLVSEPDLSLRWCGTVPGPNRLDPAQLLTHADVAELVKRADDIAPISETREPTEADLAEARALLTGMRARVQPAPEPVPAAPVDVSEARELETPATLPRTATYRGLRGGEWGIRVSGGTRPEHGDRIAVTTRAGKVKTEIVVRVLWAENNDTAWVCRVAPRY